MTRPSIYQADLFMLLVGAVRYAMGRRTYVVDATAETVRRHWRDLDQVQRDVIRRDVREALESAHRLGRELGGQCDHATWVLLLAWMEAAP